MVPNPPIQGILEKIKIHLQQADQPPYRYQQVVNSLQKGAKNFEDIIMLPKSLRKDLAAHFGFSPLPLSIATINSLKQVEKVLFKTKSNIHIETVLSKYKDGWTSMCISSQGGCGLGCTFCATGAIGLIKNLSADEICAQIFHSHWKKQLPDSIAFMGMGEALANPNIFTALAGITGEGLGGLSLRRITVSTIGHAPNLERITQEFPQVNITLSIHSPFPEQRAELIPLEKKYSLKENLTILNKYVITHHRKVYLAYLLIKDINDSLGHLEALKNLIKLQYRPDLYHISIIPYNKASGANPAYRTPHQKVVSWFVEQLKLAGISSTQRTQFGVGIDAACGQLHAKYFNNGSK